MLILWGLGLSPVGRAEMRHAEILGESELWQKLNRALMTCSQSQRRLTTEAGCAVF